MSKSKVINWTIGIVFVAANVLGLGMSHHRRQTEAAMHRHRAQLRGRQIDALTTWHGSHSVSLRSNDCLNAIRKLGSATELQPPVVATDLSWDEMPTKQSHDLAKAIHGLMVAYQQGSAKHLIKYMASRDENLTAQNVEILRDYLVQRHGFEETELEQLNLEQQFTMFWEAYGVTPDWKAFVPEESGIRIWNSDAATAEMLSETTELSKTDTNLWLFRGDRRHNFSNPESTLESHLADEGNITVADVRLIIEHKGKGVHTICPYVARFWYSTEREKWIPHLLTQYRTSDEIPSNLLF